MLFYHYIARFKREGFRILNLLLLQPSNHTEEDLREYRRKVETPGAFEVLPCRGRQFIRAARWGVELDREAVSEGVRCAAEFRPDAVVCFDLLCAWVGSLVDGGAKVAWLGDLNFRTEWYHALYAARERWAECWRLPLTWMRCQRWRRVYRDVLGRMDSVVVSAGSSVELLRRLAVAATYQPYPWPDEGSDGGLWERNPGSMPSFVFLGTLSGLGSRSAFHFIFERIYPRLVGLWGPGRFEIVICGSRGLPGWVERALEGKPELKYAGFVEDLGRVFGSCHALLAPIDVPVGNRSRIVTAMARGVLVVTHRNAALGNPDLVDGLTCYLADDADGFVEKMRRAVERREETEWVVANARECYKRRFAPEVATGGLLDETERAIEARRAKMLDRSAGAGRR